MTDYTLKVMVVVAGIAGCTVAQAQTPAALIYDPGVGAINFGSGDLKASLVQNGYSVTDLPLGDPASAKQSVRIILTTEDAKLPGQPAAKGILREGYAIQSVVTAKTTNWWVIGKDAAGAMYGALELAETVQLANGLGGLTNRQTNPYLEKRGIKFNIPLDARSPSYSDDSDSAQANISQHVGEGFLGGEVGCDGAASLQSAFALEPASVSLDGEGAGVSQRGAGGCETKIRGNVECHRHGDEDV